MSAKSNYFFNTIYTVLNMLLPLVTAPYLARIIGAEGVGIYAYNYTVAYYFMIIAKMGLINYGTRNIAKVRNDKQLLNKEFSSIFYMQVFSACIMTLLYLLYLAFFVKENMLVATLFTIIVISVAIDIDWVLFGLEQFKKVTVRNIIIKLLAVFFIFLLVKSVDDIWLYAFIMSLGFVIGYISIWIGINRDVKLVKVRWVDILAHVKPSLILLVPIMAMYVYRTMGKVMTGALSTMTETGLFDNAEKIILCLSGFIASLGTVMMPRISRLISNNESQKTLHYFELSMHYITLLTSAMAFGLISISVSLVPILFGQEFVRSTNILMLLSITLVFIGWANVVRTQYIIPHNRDRVLVVSVLLGVIVNLVFCFALIPRFGALGAAAGTICAEIIALLYMVIRIKRELPFGKYLIYSFPYLLFGGIMCCSLKYIEYAFKAGFVTMLIQIIIGAMLYIILSTIYIKKNVPELWRIIRSTLKKKQEVRE